MSPWWVNYYKFNIKILLKRNNPVRLSGERLVQYRVWRPIYKLYYLWHWLIVFIMSLSKQFTSKHAPRNNLDFLKVIEWWWWNIARKVSAGILVRNGLGIKLAGYPARAPKQKTTIGLFEKSWREEGDEFMRRTGRLS